MSRTPRPGKPVRPPRREPVAPETADQQPTAGRAPLVPVPEKIGEGKENLRAREKAFKRRRGTTP
jgi:hypothetical protein